MTSEILTVVRRGHCDDDEPYADLTNTSAEDGDLSVYSWINNAESYFCEAPESSTSTSTDKNG